MNRNNHQHQHGNAHGQGNANAASAAPNAHPSSGAMTTTTSDADTAGLVYMIEEEKLAGDLYDALFAQTGLRVFEQIGHAEDQHLATLVNQARNTGLDVDGLLSLPAGEYSNPALQSLYDTLLATGSASTTAALQVGVAVESTDIADLQAAMVGLVGTPLGSAYANLLGGSVNHLTAFESLLG